MLLNYKKFTPEDEKARQKTPLLILHGLLGSLDNWRSQAQRLSIKRPVYALDLRNHGDSPHMKGMSYREMSDDVRQVALHENIVSFHLLGHSMGGKVAMTLALTHGDLIKHLIVVDIAPKPYPPWHLKTLQGLLSIPLDKLESRREIDEYLKHWVEDPTERAFLLKNLKRRHKRNSQKAPSANYQWRCNLSEISKNYLKIAGFIHPDTRFAGKTLFISGDKSPYIQKQDHPLIKALFPNGNIVRQKNAGHLPHIDEPDVFFNLVSQFLEHT